MLKRYWWGSSEADVAMEVALQEGKAILAESDTVWGLFTPATASGALVLDKLKRRRDKPYLVIMDSLDTVTRAAVFPENGSFALAQKGWPGPLTLLLPGQEGQLYDAQSVVGTIGVRVPDHDCFRRLAAVYGGLFSTSANISGESVPLMYEQVDSSIRVMVGAVIYNHVSYKPSLQPSTIVDCTGSELKVVRQGAYSLSL